MNLDPIAKAQMYFGPSETLAEEQEAALKRYKPEIRPVLASIGVAHTEPKDFVTTPASHGDSFTCFVQENLALVIYGDHMPRELPDPKTSSPELLLDVEFYRQARLGAESFERTCQARIAAVSKNMEGKFAANKIMSDFHRHLLDKVELAVLPVHETGFASAWTGKELDQDDCFSVTLGNQDLESIGQIHLSGEHIQVVRMLHNLYQMVHYIRVAIAENISPKEARDKGFVALWKYLTDNHAMHAIRAWKKPRDHPFMKTILQLFKVWVESKKLE